MSPKLDVTRLLSLGRVTAAVPSPTGAWVCCAVARHDAEKGRFVSDLWKVPLDGAPPHALTRGATDDHSPGFRRDGALAFLSNRDPGVPGETHDDKRFQVWLFPPGGGEPVPLTDEPLGVQAFRFAGEADVLVAVAPVLLGVPREAQRARQKERAEKGPSALRYDRMPVRFWDHWLPEAAPHLIAFDGEGNGRRDLTFRADREHRNASWDLSGDGRQVVVTRGRPGPDRLDDVGLILLDTADGSARTLFEAERAWAGLPIFSPDGRQVAFTRTDRRPEARGPDALCVIPVDGGEPRRLAASFDAWPHPAAFTDDGRIVAMVSLEAEQPLVLVDPRTDEVTRLTAAGGTHEGVSVLGEHAFGLRHRLHHPPEPFRVALRPGSTPELLANLSGFSEADGRAVAGWDSREVQTPEGPVQHTLVRPVGEGPFPTVMWIHGGPISAWADSWHWRWNPLVAASEGYAVSLPNPSGSTGFGQALVEAIWGNVWGDRCYRDLMAVADALAADEAVDASRMAAMGGSFGGYMTNWIGGNTDRFRCLVTHASVFSMSAFHGVTDSPAYWALFMGGQPWDDPHEYDRYSPARRLPHWRSPTLVIHGEKDYRVPIGEALALFEGLQHHGVPSELLVFPDENHWIQKPRNIATWYEAVLVFLGHHLKDEAPAKAPPGADQTWA